MTRSQRFGETLRKRRNAAGKTLGDIARFLGVSIPYVSDVERGARAPWDEKRIRAVAAFLGTDPDGLLAAAAESRGAFELDASRASRTKREVGIALMRGWTGWDDEDLSKLKAFLETLGKKE